MSSMVQKANVSLLNKSVSYRNSTVLKAVLAHNTFQPAEITFAIHTAIKAGNASCVYEILKNGKDKKGKNTQEYEEDHMLAIHTAALNGKNSIIENLLYYNLAVIDEKVTQGKYEGCTPLLLAAIHGHSDTVKTLLKYNCDTTVTYLEMTYKQILNRTHVLLRSYYMLKRVKKQVVTKFMALPLTLGILAFKRIKKTSKYYAMRYVNSHMDHLWDYVNEGEVANWHTLAMIGILPLSYGLYKFYCYKQFRKQICNNKRRQS